MSKLTQYTVLLLLVHYPAITAKCGEHVPANEICPTLEKKDEAIQNIRATKPKLIKSYNNAGIKLIIYW